MSTQSPTSPDLFLLHDANDFQTFAVKLLAQTRRNLSILSHDLDSIIFNTEEFVTAVSQIARSSHVAHIQILVKDIQPILENGHKLVKLAQRLPSKISIRKLTVEPDDTKMGFILCDNTSLLYKNDDSVYQGFANFKAAAEVKHLRETFEYIWQYGETDPELQQLYI